MRTLSKLPATKGDIISAHGANGGVISTVIVTDDKACGRVPGISGYECRDATPVEIKAADDQGKHQHVYC